MGSDAALNQLSTPVFCHHNLASKEVGDSGRCSVNEARSRIAEHPIKGLFLVFVSPLGVEKW